MGEAGKTEETTSWHGNRCVHPGGILGWSRTGRLVLVMSRMRARERERAREKQARPSSSSSRAWMHVNNHTERTEHPSAVHRMCFVSRSIGLHVLCHFESRLSLALAPPPVVILALLLPPTVLPYITTYILYTQTATYTSCTCTSVDIPPTTFSRGWLGPPVAPC